MKRPQEDAHVPDDGLVEFIAYAPAADSPAPRPKATQPDALVEFFWRGEAEVAGPTRGSADDRPRETRISRRFSPAVELLIRARMATGIYASEDALLLAALESLDEHDVELQAIQAALESLDRGEPGTELAEAFRKIRTRYGIRD
jgi:hypothetical protein